MRRRYFIAGGIAAAAASALRSPTSTAASASKPMVLTLAGDSVITRRINRSGDARFDSVARLLQSSDVAIASCAMSFGDAAAFEPAPKGIDTNLICNSAGAEDLAWMGIDLVSCATNHALDYGTQGLASTLQSLQRAGISAAGAGRTLKQASEPSYADSINGRVALIGCATTFSEGSIAADARQDSNGRAGINPIRVDVTYRLPPAEFEQLRRVGKVLAQGVAPLHDLVPDADGLLEASGSVDTLSFLDRKFVRGDLGVDATPREYDVRRLLDAIATAREKASIVCVMLHEHGNYGPGTFIQKLAHDCIDAGADCFMVSGSHLLGAIELFRGKVIAHGLGSLFFQYDTLSRVPAETFQAYGFDPQARDTSLVTNAMSDRYLEKNSAYWSSALLRLAYDSNAALAGLSIHPIVLGLGDARFERGTPRMATPPEAADILARLQEAGRPFGTRLAVRDSVGFVQLR